MSIQLIKPSDLRWVDFLNANYRSAIFEHPEWSRLMSLTYGYRPFVAVCADNAGSIRAGFPLMEVKTAVTGRRWVALPFSDYCSPIYEDNHDLRELVDGIVSLAAAEKVSLVEFRGECPNLPNLQGYSEHVIHKVTLGQNVDSVAKRVHEVHRRNIKIAKRNDVKIVWGDTREHLKTFYNLHLHTRRKQGIPIQPWRFFDKLKTILIDQGLGFILLAYKDFQCIAGAIFLHWHKTLTYKYGASNTAYLALRPNNLIMWTAIEWGCKNGFTSFDLGRSSKSNKGLRDFKSRWGAEESELMYTRSAPLSNRKYLDKVMEASSVILKNSPLWLCKLTGEVVYKHFG